MIAIVQVACNTPKRIGIAQVLLSTSTRRGASRQRDHVHSRSHVYAYAFSRILRQSTQRAEMQRDGATGISELRRHEV
jgi:hypothetical protein